MGVNSSFADPSDPYEDGSAITPNDSTTFATCRALYVGGAGAVRVLTKGGTDLSFSAVPAGTTIRIAVTKVFSTNTTATAIVALY
jgi:hypothetical protein